MLIRSAMFNSGSAIVKSDEDANGPACVSGAGCINDQQNRLTKTKNANSLVVAIPRNDARENRLKQSHHLPRSSFSMSEETLLGHDWDSVSRCTSDRREDVVPDLCLVLFL
jgi:hypothetical protein